MIYNPIFGVLAGMGPRGTSLFIDNIVDTCIELYGAKDDIDFPPILNIIDETVKILSNESNILFIMGARLTVQNKLYNEKVL